MDETDRPDDRRAAGSWVLPNSESRRQGNHEVAKSGIRKRKKTKTYPRLSCKIQHLLTSNHSDKSIASEFFTGDSNKEVSPKNQRHAELLRSRIEELDRRLAILNSDRTLLQRLLR